MALKTGDEMKSRVEELSEENRTSEEGQVENLDTKISVLEQEVKDLKSGHEVVVIKMNTIEQEVKDLKNGQEEVMNKMSVLEQENQRLKLKILEMMEKVMGKLEILEHKISNGVEGDANGQEVMESLESTSPPPRKKQRKIDSLALDPGPVVCSAKQIPVTVAINPLEIEKIVRIVMGHVTPLDLLRCRQVSKLWKKAAEKDFQEKVMFHVTFNLYRDVELFKTHAAQSFPMFRNLTLDLKRPVTSDILKGMIQLFRTHGKFLQKLQLNFSRKTYSGNLTLDDFRDIFLRSLGEIRELQIKMFCHFIHEDYMLLDRHVLTKLTTLNIELNCSECNLKNHRNTQVFADFMSLTPNLRTLYWRSRNYQDQKQDGSKNFIQSLLLANPIKLENLFIYSKIADGLVCSIANSNLNLKQLYLVEFRGFGLHFFSTPPTGQGKKCEVTPKNPTYSNGQIRHTGPALKTYFEDVLANTGNMSCTGLLQVFTSLL